MRLKLLLAAMLMLVPLPALADVTATYEVSPGTLTVEAADNGDWRITIGPAEIVILHREGVDYVIRRDKDGVERVARADGAFGALLGQMPPSNEKMVFESSQGGTDTMAGFSGTLWTYGPNGEQPVEMLMSADPRLVPVGNAFRQMIELVLGASGDLLGPDALRPIFASGTLLRIATPGEDKPGAVIALDSVRMDVIDPAHFMLPGPVMPAKDFIALVAPPMTTHAEMIEVK